jgi:diacylglycerol kinase (ATP)
MRRVLLQVRSGWLTSVLAQLIVNERSRRGRELGTFVRVALRDAGIDSVEEGRPADVVDGVDCIVCAGGDGTLLSGVGAAIARGLPLGVVPLGTFNELARTLSIPLDIRGAVRTIAERCQRSIDVGRVNDTYFVNEASIGISSRVTRLQTTDLKRRFGLFGVAATTFSALWHSRPIHAEVRYDGRSEAMRTIQLTVANSHRFGGFLNVADAAIDDGWLDLYSVDIGSMREAFSIARAMFAGRRRDVPGLRVLRAARFDVFTRHDHRITADGEPAGVTPATFEVFPKALRVFAPQY